MSKLTFSLTRTSESPGWAPASSAAHTNLWRDAAVAATTATGALAAGPGGSFTSTGDLTLSEVTFAGGTKVGRPGGSAVSVDWDPTGLRALLSMDLVWNTIKNVSVTEFVGERLEIRNWVDVFVALQSAGPLTVVLEAAKRGEVLLTGDGDFTVEIGIDSNSKDWTNAFRIRTDGGDDVVRIRESAINAVSGRYLGQFTDTDIATGAGNDQVFGWGSNDAIDGGEGRDVFVLRGIQAGYRITTDGEWTTIVDIDARDGNDGTDRLRNVELIKFSVGADLVLVPLNREPVAADDAYTVRPGQTLQVSAALGVLANDTDADGDALQVITITPADNGEVAAFANGSFTYTPNTGFSGTDQFTYTVRDGFGGFDTATVTITVVNVEPVAADDAYTVRPGQTLQISAALGVLANDTDADGDALQVITITPADNGEVAAFANGSFTYTPNTGFSGTDQFTYTVRDGFGGFDTAVVTIAVVNRAPVAAIDFYATIAGQVLTVPVGQGFLSNDTDADGDRLTVAAIIDRPDNGTLTVGRPDGSFIYTPNAGFVGTDSFFYSIRDGFGGFGTATVFITVTNAAPSAADDAYVMRPGQELDISAALGILANDGDADGHAITVTAVSDSTDNGTLTFAADGSFTYTPNANFSATDQFTYTISDGFGGTDTATVTIAVVNARPVAVNDSYATGPGQTLTVLAAQGFLANDTDADGDRLSVAAILDRPDNGTLSVGRPDGSFTYTPNAGFVGTDSFLYSIRDGFGGFSSATVFIAVTNAAPSAADDAYVMRPGQVLDVSTTLGVLANDSDADGHAITVTAVSDTTDNGTLSFSADGRFTYTPNANFTGTDQFTYTIGDGFGGVDEATVTIAVRNTPPVAVNDAYATAPGQALALPVAQGFLANDTDADGDRLSVAAIIDRPDNGTLTIARPDGSFTYTPNAGFVGTDSFVYTIRDGFGGFSSATVSILVANGDPVADAVDDSFTVNAGGTLVRTAEDGLFANDLGGIAQRVAEDDVGRYNIAGKGVLDIFEDGAIAFTAASGFTGLVEMEIDVVFDGVTNVDTARLTITVLDPFI